MWQTPRYRLLVASTDGGQEVALDLWISENKILVRQLEELRDKEVIVTGDVVRVPKGSTIGSDADDTKGFSDFAIRRAR